MSEPAPPPPAATRPTPSPSPTLPLTYESVGEAHRLVKPFVHETPVLTCAALNEWASVPQTEAALKGTQWEGQPPARPRFHFFFKAENLQKIGAFKIRGATHAIARLSDAERAKGVLTHSSGNHAQALALAAKRRGITAHVVMPTISTPSKIAATKGYGAYVTFSGPTEPERDAAAARVQAETGATFVPPYNHPHIILGQGTMGLELEDQVADIVEEDPARSRRSHAPPAPSADRPPPTTAGPAWPPNKTDPSSLDAVIAPLGGGGMLSGVALAFSTSRCWVFGAEPSFSGADDGRRGLLAGKRIETVSSLTIADGLRTPVGTIPWGIISDPHYVRGLYSVTDDQIKAALKLIMERLKMVVEPSAAVGLAACLFDEDLRRVVEVEGGAAGWDVGIVLSGGNTTVEALADLFRAPGEHRLE